MPLDLGQFNRKLAEVIAYSVGVLSLAEMGV
jgi:hypothetical protein